MPDDEATLPSWRPPTFESDPFPDMRAEVAKLRDEVRRLARVVDILRGVVTRYDH